MDLLLSPDGAMFGWHELFGKKPAALFLIQKDHDLRSESFFRGRCPLLTCRPSIGLRPVAQVLSAIGASTITISPEVCLDLRRIRDSRFYFKYHHTTTDIFDKVKPEELNENAAVMSVLANALADANASNAVISNSRSISELLRPVAPNSLGLQGKERS
jgi:hypothetical protein